MVHTTITSRTFFCKFFLDPHAAEDSERAIVANIIQQKQ
jgi:hypothetical protein